MRILLDESVPQKLRLLIEPVHTVVTTWYQGWSGLKNGALLEAAEGAGFEVFLTADQELAYQQNLAGRRIAVIVLGTNNWGVIRERVDVIAGAIERVGAGGYLFVELM